MTTTGGPGREADDQHEVVRWYTRARKFPQMIGKTPGGERIPGGPYTFAQVLVAAGVLVVGWKTVWLWGNFGGLGNILLLGVATAGAVAATGRVQPGARNPVSILIGTIRALSAPPGGAVGGRPVRERRPETFESRVVILAPVSVVASAPAAAPLAVVSETQIQEGTGERSASADGAQTIPMTNVERLLGSRKQEG
jgi:hypothetical protein